MQRSRLGAEEAGGLDLRLELGGRGPGERTRVRIALEERRRHLVHALVGALRRQDRRDEQLVGVREMQLGVGAGMLFGELLENVTRRRDVPEGFQWALCRGPSLRHPLIVTPPIDARQSPDAPDPELTAGT